MLKVGLTGNIASGKSTVADVWRTQGARVIDADELARRAVEPGSDALARIAARFGPEVIAPGGELDRAAMRARVFSAPEERAALEAIVHPRVAALRDEEYRRALAEGETVVVADIPLLFEVGLQTEFDLVVLVDAPAFLREERLVRHRRLQREEAKRMIAAQMPSDQKRALSDVVIENVGSLERLKGDAAKVWSMILKRAGERG